MWIRLFDRNLRKVIKSFHGKVWFWFWRIWYCFTRRKCISFTKASKTIYWLLKDFISRLLRKRSEKRMSASECLEHSWLEEKEISNKTSKIKIENLRKFLARRKLQNVGRVLRAINVFKETARDSRYFICPLLFSLYKSYFRSRSKEESSGESEED